MFYKEKLVSDGEKSVSDFEHFTITHPHSFHTSYWGHRCVDICQTINIFLHAPLSEVCSHGVLSGLRVQK